MSNKRFTNAKKWQTTWFRTLPMKAKLAWIYLCDECEFTGLFKIDYGLAGFQLDFDITPTLLGQWFGDKIYFFNDDRIFIVPFFEFQYGESKDTWSAKVRAKSKIEALGFNVVDNKVVIPKDTVPPLSHDSEGTGLIIGLGIVNLNNKKEVKNFKKEIEEIYRNQYPLKKGKSDGVESLSKQIKSEQDLKDLSSAIEKYKNSLKPGTSPEYIKHFSTFANSKWRDWLDPEAGQADAIAIEKADLSQIQWGKS